MVHGLDEDVCYSQARSPLENHFQQPGKRRGYPQGMMDVTSTLQQRFQAQREPRSTLGQELQKRRIEQEKTPARSGDGRRCPLK